MKNIKTHQFLLFAITTVTLASCSNYNPSEGLTSGYNPLDPAGSIEKPAEEDVYAPTFSPGTFLATQSPNVAFFSGAPTQSSQPTKTLAADTEVKVISSKAVYTKVEVVNTGEVGFVPTVQIGEKRSVNEIPVIPGMGDLPINEDLPSLLPEGETAVDSEIPSSFSVVEDLPFVAPDPVNTGINPPEVVDPLLPAE